MHSAKRILARQALATSTLLILILLAPLVARAQTIIYVNDDAQGANNGSSWADAFNSLQDARDAALIGGGAEIWVAEGVYYPDRGLSQVLGDRLASFILSDGVELFGGFRGNETSREQRDYKLNISILSGDIGTEDNSSDNSYHIITASNSNTGTLDGFTVVGGNADGNDATEDGGGLYLINGNVSIRNSVFSDNSSDHYGGGIFADNSTVDLVNVMFIGNTAVNAGGGAYFSGGKSTLDNCLFQNNTTTSNSGRGAGLNADTDLTVTTCVFLQNTAFGGSSDGGGIRISGGNAVVSAFFAGNIAASGGGIHNSASDLKIYNTIFSGNSANNGGGLYNESNSRDLLVVNTTFNGNSDSGIHNFLAGTEQVYRNVILTDGMSNGNETPFIDYSLIKSALPLNIIDGGNNVIGTPIFFNPGGLDSVIGTVDDDLRLNTNSLGIDMGANGALDLNGNGDLSDDIPLDPDGFPRLYDGNADGIAIVDIGAYESPLPPPTNVSATSGDSEIFLTWAKVNGSAIAGYNIYRSSSPEPTTVTSSVNAETSSFTDGEVSNYLPYYYRVAAVDMDGLAGRFSSEVFAMPIDLTPPAVPTGFVAVAGDSLVTLIWDPNDEGDLAGYRIVRDTTAEPVTLLEPVNAGKETFDDLGLANSITYYYRIAAADTAGNVSDYSEVISATPIGTAFLQFVHNAPDVPDLKVSVGGERIVDSLSYKSATNFIELRAVDVDLLVTYIGTGGLTETVLDTTITLIDEKTYVFVANGLLGGEGEDAFRLVLNEEARYKASNPLSVDFFVFHGSTDAPTVEVNLLDSTPNHTKISVLANNLRFGEFTTYRSVSADFYNIEIVSSLTGQQVDVYALDVSGLAGSSVILVLGGYLQPTGEDLPFGMLVFSGEPEPAFAPVVTHADEEPALPTELLVHGSYPNPFRQNASLTLDVPSASEAVLELYDMLGRKVYTTGRVLLDAGISRSIQLDGRSLAAGLYAYRLVLNSPGTTQIKTGQMVKIR